MNKWWITMYKWVINYHEYEWVINYQTWMRNEYEDEYEDEYVE